MKSKVKVKKYFPLSYEKILIKFINEPLENKKINIQFKNKQRVRTNIL